MCLITKQCLAILTTFKIINIAWAVGYSNPGLKCTRYYVYVGLHGPGWLYVIGLPPRADLPLWTPRARATDLGQGPNLSKGSGRTPCVQRSWEHEGRPAAGREKNANRSNKHIYISVYQAALRDVRNVKSRGWRKLKRDKKVTAIVTACICWRKHGIYLLWGLISD